MATKVPFWSLYPQQAPLTLSALSAGSDNLAFAAAAGARFSPAAPIDIIQIAGRSTINAADLSQFDETTNAINIQFFFKTGLTGSFLTGAEQTTLQGYLNALSTAVTNAGFNSFGLLPWISYFATSTAAGSFSIGMSSPTVGAAAPGLLRSHLVTSDAPPSVIAMPENWLENIAGNFALIPRAFTGPGGSGALPVGFSASLIISAVIIMGNTVLNQ
jgi:hypothetical protein